MQKTIDRYQKYTKGGNNSKYVEQDMQVSVHSEDGFLYLKYYFDLIKYNFILIMGVSWWSCTHFP